MFPGAAPKAKAELKGIDRDIAFLEKSMEQIKDTIDEAEEQFENATTTKQKSEFARDKGQLVSQYSQAMQALKTLKDQQDVLDSGYFAYVAMFFAAIGGTAMKKFSDHSVMLTLDGVKGIVGRVRSRSRKKSNKPDHSMY
jgi:predicted RNase H-like nuclease